jgi:Ca2+-binding EF-hand superfamily protein
LALPSVDGERFVDETWELLLAEMDVDDTGFEDLDHLIESIPHQ